MFRFFTETNGTKLNYLTSKYKYTKGGRGIEENISNYSIALCIGGNCIGGRYDIYA